MLFRALIQYVPSSAVYLVTCNAADACVFTPAVARTCCHDREVDDGRHFRAAGTTNTHEGPPRFRWLLALRRSLRQVQVTDEMRSDTRDSRVQRQSRDSGNGTRRVVAEYSYEGTRD
jgi:hypothetical protein